MPGPLYGIANDRCRLVKFYGDADYRKVFDLQKDLEEMTSLYDDPPCADERKEVHAELDRR